MSLRWLATVQLGDHSDGELPSLKAGEGMGVMFIVSSSSATACTAKVRASVGPDDTPVVVATQGLSVSRDRFVVDATTDEAFADSWARLTGTLSTGPRLPASYKSPTLQEAG